ncbi:GL18200 [Drosophila persimilis]|uniref:Large ribosomal subunit protein eL8 n=1 Tax=Drosophila persimilis TaxID=7234 RepID=B4HBB8_DROPE|nr:GL18200 [Drosophila persimilis]
MWATYDWEVKEWDTSDHNMIHVVVTTDPNDAVEPIAPVPSWKLSNARWRLFEEEVVRETAELPEDIAESPLDNQVSALRSVVHSVRDRVLGRSTPRAARKVVWWTAELHSERRKVRRLRRRFQDARRHETDAAEELVHALRISSAQYKKLILRSKEDNWRRFVGENRDDPWGHVYRICRGRKKSTEIGCLRTSPLVRSARMLTTCSSSSKGMPDQSSIKKERDYPAGGERSAVRRRLANLSWKQKMARLDEDLLCEWQRRLDDGDSPGRVTHRFMPNAGFVYSERRFGFTLRAGFLLTGHGSLNAFLHGRSLSDTPACLCGAEREDWQDFLCACPLYIDLRDLDGLGVQYTDGDWTFSDVTDSQERMRILDRFAGLAFSRRQQLLNAQAAHRLGGFPIQFSQSLDKTTAVKLFKLLEKYRPESPLAKKQRLKKIAEAKAKGKEVEPKKKPSYLSAGTNTVTKLIEQKKAQLVVIAHDVDPLELVLFLPALCRKMGVPYCIVKGKARLGRLVRRKTCTTLALTSVDNNDKANFSKVLEAVKTNFNERHEEIRRHWGGGILGSKSLTRIAKLERAKARELAQKQG